MSEENKNPMDLDGDGKVTIKERIQYTAMQAKAKAEEIAEQVKESEAYAKAKDVAAKASGKASEMIDKAKESEAYAKAKDVAAKAGEKASEMIAKVKGENPQA